MAADMDEGANFQTFRECLSAAILRDSQMQTSKPPRKGRGSSTRSTGVKKNSVATPPKAREDPAEMAEFINYVAAEIFSNLPEEVQMLSYSALQNDSSLAERFEDPLPEATMDLVIASVPAEVEDSLLTYKYIEPPKTDMTTFMAPVLSSYVTAVTAAPPEWITTKTEACEICERDWIPLTYHHLIPRGVHAKVIKRGWHEEWMLNSVAWLCRACHSFVHRMASNEELAKEWYTVDKILVREDVQSWRSWVSKVRWKAR